MPSTHDASRMCQAAFAGLAGRSQRQQAVLISTAFKAQAPVPSCETAGSPLLPCLKGSSLDASKGGTHLGRIKAVQLPHHRQVSIVAHHDPVAARRPARCCCPEVDVVRRQEFGRAVIAEAASVLELLRLHFCGADRCPQLAVELAQPQELPGQLHQARVHAAIAGVILQHWCDAFWMACALIAASPLPWSSIC